MTAVLYDFEVHFVRLHDGYIIHAHCPLLGERGPFTVEAEALTTCRTAGRGSVPGAATDVEALRSIGQHLYRTLFVAPLREALDQARALAGRAAGVRLILKLDQNTQLHGLAWESLHDERDFLGLDPAFSIVRYLTQEAPVQPLEVAAPLRVLLTTAGPDTLPSLKLDDEIRRIETALAPLAGAVSLEVVPRISLGLLDHTLRHAVNRGRPFHVWHHCGHGGYLRRERPDAFCLALEVEGAPELVDVTPIGRILRAQPELRLVMLNVCHGAAPSGLSPALAGLNVPAVIGFRSDIADPAALLFAQTFYRSLGDVPLDIAVGQARLSLAALRDNRTDWAQPVVYLRSTHPKLLARATTAASEGEPRQESEGGWTRQKIREIVDADEVELLGQEGTGVGRSRVDQQVDSITKARKVKITGVTNTK